jgi:hypothetical protein
MYIPQGAEEDIWGKWSVVTGNYGKLHNGKLHEISTLSTDIFRLAKSRVRCAGHVARTVDSEVHTVLMGKPEEKRSLGRPRRSWKDNIQMDIQEIGSGAWSGLIWLWKGTSDELL